VEVDSYAGTAQGRIPLFAGSKVINRDRILVTAMSGRELGRGSLDGQISNVSPFAETDGVSGYIGTDGKYMLVFKDATVGAAIVTFEMTAVKGNIAQPLT